MQNDLDAKTEEVVNAKQQLERQCLDFGNV